MRWQLFRQCCYTASVETEGTYFRGFGAMWRLTYLLTYLLISSRFLSLCTSVWLGVSCWSGFVGRVRGWRTERPTTRCPVRAASWPSSATTAALTSRQKSTRRRSSRRRSTRYRLDCDSATGRRTCQQRARWCRSVVSELVAKSLQPVGARGLPFSPHQSW